ncbi:ABC transporter ATP-binding protein [Cedecea davisae]|uniref:ABC transporter ATP-binding protein n=1 Tax=Cedecea davisae TaxID=158484 RepID=A0ABS6DIF0_9ENTR|nr:ABC transporter ATP-binding protein [Cedecea davisae]MBU4682987.1 ABC transporter ATP-binding protein [Cedecea davisae]MBU4687914.1 ABC transporter ATP-binding protein [Cedecea davisae]
MNSHIRLKNVSLEFEIYHNKTSSLKELFSNLFTDDNNTPKEKFKALSEINLEIFHGDRIGIIGHNGAGKSSLLKTLCKIYSPTSGTVEVVGHVAPLLEIGAGFNAELSGRENIYLNGTILGYTTKQIKRIEKDIIEFSELEQFIDMPVKYYSTGMYMKLAFSIATAVKPEILVLDELFAGGDAEFIQKAQKRMKDIIAGSSIMVFVSHQLELLSELCNRVIWLDHGTIIEDGEPKKVISKYLEKYQD